ncbi:MAG: hypothetical protein Q4A21_01855 [bacterium]|nr:hypothetical protein [bacterium]
MAQINLSRSLQIGFDAEMRKLEEFSNVGSIIAARIRDFVENELQTEFPEISEYLEKDLFELKEEQYQIEIFLALIGYNKTLFLAEKPIDQQKAKYLVEFRNIFDERTRYELIYDSSITAEEVLMLARNGFSNDFYQLLLISKGKNVRLEELIGEIKKNIAKINRKEANSLQKSKLKELAILLSVSNDREFEKILTLFKKLDQFFLGRIIVVARDLLFSRIDEDEFKEILNSCRESSDKIIPMRNKMIAIE